MYIKCFALCLAHDKCSINGTNDDDDEEGVMEEDDDLGADRKYFIS